MYNMPRVSISHTPPPHSPSARQVVITAGRPSGIAATASATAILK